MMADMILLAIMIIIAYVALGGGALGLHKVHEARKFAREYPKAVDGKSWPWPWLLRNKVTQESWHEGVLTQKEREAFAPISAIIAGAEERAIEEYYGTSGYADPGTIQEQEARELFAGYTPPHATPEISGPYWDQLCTKFSQYEATLRELDLRLASLVKIGRKANDMQYTHPPIDEEIRVVREARLEAWEAAQKISEEMSLMSGAPTIHHGLITQNERRMIASQGIPPPRVMTETHALGGPSRAYLEGIGLVTADDPEKLRSAIEVVQHDPSYWSKVQILDVEDDTD